MAEHVRAVLHLCAQTLYALKVLRSHGLPSVALHNIYQSVVMAKVMHAATILNDNEHVLHRLLPPKSNAFQLYNLRPRTHDRQLPEQSFYLNSCNFIHRLLYANSY
jgi:hypothetical protein